MGTNSRMFTYELGHWQRMNEQQECKRYETWPQQLQFIITNIRFKNNKVYIDYSNFTSNLIKLLKI